MSDGEEEFVQFVRKVYASQAQRDAIVLHDRVREKESVVDEPASHER